MPLEDLLIFHQVARSLNSSFDLDTILRTILEHMERMIRADLWTLLILNEDRTELRYVLASDGKEKDLGELRVRIGEGVAGWVAQHGESLIVPEAGNDPRLRNEGALAAIRSVVALPLRGRKGTHGVIEIFNPESGQLSDYSIAFLHILADHAAIAIENSRDVARIQQLSITDDCTGLYNVRHLYEALGHEFKQLTSPKGHPLSLAFLDLDHFKRINDLHGHLIGSELLNRVGIELRSLTRSRDLCFRYGGDEFAIMMPETSSGEAFALTKQLLSRLMSHRFNMSEELVLTVSASVGVATAPEDGMTVHDLIAAADKRMYAVKENGRGKVYARS